MTTIKQPSKASASGMRHYVALDSLRGICALAVVLYHLPTSGRLANLAFFHNAWLFVDFFFVLSGFVIAASYWDKLAAGFPVSRFMVLRLGRVYPLHVFVLGIMVLVELAKVFGGHGTNAAFTGNSLPSALATNLTLTQIFGFHDKVMWNSPAWSIAAEVWAYLIAALALSLLRARTFWAAVLVASAMPLLLGWVDGHGLDRTYDMALERCLYGFSLGMIAQRLHARGILVATGRAVATLCEVVLVAAVVTAVSMADHGRLTLLFPFLFAVTVHVFAGDRGAVSDMLSTRLPKLLGALSYSIYMIHIFVIARFVGAAEILGRMMHVEMVRIGDTQVGTVKMLAGKGLSPDLATIVCLVAISVLAWFSYRWIEIPARDWSRRLSKALGERDAGTHTSGAVL